MATPNGRGGWDLTDADVAEVMSASFGQRDTGPSPRTQAIIECIGALEAAGHTRYGIYDECECPDDVRQRDGHLLELEEFSGCEKSLVYWACRECCSDDGYHSEACATYHDHGDDKPYCAVLAVIVALLPDGETP